MVQRIENHGVFHGQNGSGQHLSKIAFSFVFPHDYSEVSDVYVTAWRWLFQHAIGFVLLQNVAREYATSEHRAHAHGTAEKIVWRLGVEALERSITYW